MTSMKDMNVKEFVDELYSNSPAPGGGSVAALSAALSSALSGMVFNLTVDKKLYASYDEEVKNEIQTQLSKAYDLKEEFLDLMELDVKAFNEVIAAFRLPKETEEEKEIRSNKIQEAYIKAMDIPLKTARRAIEVFDCLQTAAKYGNPNAISDAGVGALLALAAVESAILNVRINLGSIKNKEFVDNIASECSKIVEMAQYKKEFIIEIVNSKI